MTRYGGPFGAAVVLAIGLMVAGGGRLTGLPDLTSPSGSLSDGAVSAGALSSVPAVARPVAVRLGSRGPSAAQVRTVESGLVDVDTVLDGGFARGAGTGIVLAANGLILTNAHVVAGAQLLAVTDIGTGRSYRAVVLGADPADDVAVVRAVGASGLPVAPLAPGATPGPGAGVVAIGNAGGVGGVPATAAGSVTANGEDAVIYGDDGGAESLTDLLATSARLRPGDSGGALVDGTGRVVGMDTAAALNRSGAGRGYAIPIGRALSIARRLV